MDLHRHDEFSTFDGFGKALELAELAKKLGHTALGTSNHGNTSGLIQTYKACKDVGIKPVLGIEAYFKPKENKERKSYHLCLFAKNLEGYGNLNRILYLAEKQKYYTPIVTLKNLEKYNEGIICSSACIASFFSQCIVNGEEQKAFKALKKFKHIFGEDFYVEIQPYKVDDKRTQENINTVLISMAKKLDIPCILTSDSHYGKKEDFPTYLKMHEVAGHTFYNFKETYKERYMPTDKELEDRFTKLHKDDFKNSRKVAKQMMKNLKELEDKVEGDFLSELPLELPQMSEGKESYDKLLEKVKQGLKDRGKYKKKYYKRCLEELDVIKYHGFSDYFLIVADYVNWAKQQGIVVGPGRGSVCNSLVAYSLKITEVDSLLFNLDFRRFLRKDKKKFPDIDLDFETHRRQEVIQYLVKKYKGHAAQISAYGLYKVDNLVNDLVKVCGLPTTGKEISKEEANENKKIVAEIKKFINKYIEDGRLLTDKMMATSQAKAYNIKYDDILIHFSKLFKKLRYFTTHAAGVAITGGKLINYTAVKIDSKGNIFSCYDLGDLEEVNVIKFDMLGLKTMESLAELRSLTGNSEPKDEWFTDPKILKAFCEGETDGIFQFEKGTVRDILRKIHCDCFDDVVAASSMNRPGPLSLNMPDAYAYNKYNVEKAQGTKYWEYTKETYGTIVYQEQLQQICVNIGMMSWGDADKVMKILKGSNMTEESLKRMESYKKEMLEKFVKGAIQNGFSKNEAADLFEDLLSYLFNKGHGVGYSIISVEEMYYKVYHPTEYWYVKMKYAKDKGDLFKFRMKAIASGIVIFLPHVNGSVDFSLKEYDGDLVIQEGLTSINGIGPKAMEVVERERAKSKFRSEDDFVYRCQDRSMNKGVVSKLKEQGALEFNRKIYLKRVVKYNSSLLARC